MIMHILGPLSWKNLLIQLLGGLLANSLQLSVLSGIASAAESCLGEVTRVRGLSDKDRGIKDQPFWLKAK